MHDSIDFFDPIADPILETPSGGHVLVLDPAAGPREAVRQALAADHRVAVTGDSSEAFQHLHAEAVDVLIVDLAALGSGGDAWLRQVRDHFPGLEILIVTGPASVAAAAEAVRCGACDYLEKPCDLARLQSSVTRAVTRRRGNRNAEDQVFAAVGAFIEVVEARHPVYVGHARRTALYAEQLAEQLGLSHFERSTIRTAALLHDLGAAGSATSDAGVTRSHATHHANLGARIAEALPVGEEVVDAIRHHHAHWDGRDAGNEPAGAAIPIAARVLAVADAYDELCVGRPWREGLDPERARRALTRQAGRRLDPVLTKEFVNLLEISDGDLQLIADTLETVATQPGHAVSEASEAVMGGGW